MTSIKPDSDIVLIVGAGSTFADSTSGSKFRKPPLDRNFFRLAKKQHPHETSRIVSFLQKTFNIDILKDPHDSVEQIMVMLYSDTYHPTLGSDSFKTFRRLVQLYNKRIAETTNDLDPNNKRRFFRLISNFAAHLKRLNQITFVTFNQDIHIERTLSKFDSYSKYASHGRFLSFPECYGFISPTLTTPSSGVPCFEKHNDGSQSPRIYKLHGSLNWFSTHNSPHPSPNQIFNPTRKISITRRSKLNTQFRKVTGARSVPTFPIIVPPVLHKSSILHNDLKPMWSDAEKRIGRATDIIIYGYSCPESDVESSNMIRRAISKNKRLRSISVIDPNPDVGRRYFQLLDVGFLSCYRTADEFLSVNSV